MFPHLTTERLQLRSLSVDDAQEIYLLRSDEKHNEFIDRPRATSLDDAKAFIDNIEKLLSEGTSHFWVVSFKNDPKLIGTLTLWNFDKERNTAEIGYELLPAYYGKGIMTEALPPVVDFAFKTLKLSKIEAWTHENNIRSSALLLKFGFKRDAEAEKNRPEDVHVLNFSKKNGE
jgi:[ribosomal protein S5]-alanine N-acetyltransferase